MRQSDGKHFGQRLREARVAAGLSQSELEDISGIPKARLSRYENGHVEPSIQTLARLSRALNVSEASLLGDQRAILEDFFQILYDRGVRIRSSDQGARIANAIADLLEALAVKIDSVQAEETSFPVPDGEKSLAPQALS
jgi:transcriptional regulator with XRE-family HTH domain